MPFLPQVRHCKSTSECGMAHVSWRHSPQLVARKRIQRSTNMSFVLQLQAVIQNCLGAHCQLPELLPEKNSLLQRVVSAKIAVMDCGFKLIRIFQRELWWIFKLNTDVCMSSEHGVALNYTSSITSHPQCIWILIHACLKEKVDMTWETNSMERTAALSSPLFPPLFHNSEPSSACNI